MYQNSIMSDNASFPSGDLTSIAHFLNAAVLRQQDACQMNKLKNRENSHCVHEAIGVCKLAELNVKASQIVGGDANLSIPIFDDSNKIHVIHSRGPGSAGRCSRAPRSSPGPVSGRASPCARTRCRPRPRHRLSTRGCPKPLIDLHRPISVKCIAPRARRRDETAAVCRIARPLARTGASHGADALVEIPLSCSRWRKMLQRVCPPGR